jgi:epoxyqueuosine reductase
MTTLESKTPAACGSLEPAAHLAARLKAEALRLGFDQVGVAPAVAPPGYPRYLEWLSKGHAAGMAYLERQAAARAHPGQLLEGVRSVVMASFVYGKRSPEPADRSSAKVARYARGADYHKVLWRRLEALLAWLKAERPGTRGRVVADTAPLLERDFAGLAGLGWIGKNTMLIHPRLGSYTLFGALLTDLDLTPDPPFEANHCGTCTRCLDACPTGAFVGPNELDARRCISFWNIEHRGPIPEEYADKLDGWVFGCDICQEVCPWNRKAPDAREPALEPRPEWVEPDLVAWLAADDAVLCKLMRGTALSRAKRSGLLRNAALILGERGAVSAVGALIRRLSDPDPVVRGAAAWALGRIGNPEAVRGLEDARSDADPAVRSAIERALAALAGRPATPNEQG